MKNKFACVHGHFYQPPRENPWLGVIEPEESAQPYRDWNERIFDECYGPNSACPLLGEDALIVDMADNYAKMSFNFGPTLLSWLEREKPILYRHILETDAAGARQNDGHGPAMAQPYYHAILPLQTLQEKRTLVRWGLEDFEARFQRKAEGLWLPETAVDEETLEVLADEGLRFTVLSPTQAAQIKEIGDGPWREVTKHNLQPTRPYLWRSSSRPGKSLAIFFYHQALHEGVVSGELFAAPDLLARKILARYHPDDSSQLVNVATDGEFYGHHHKAGASALACTFRNLEAEGVQAISYAAYLARFPPPQEVRIKPNTAWSCAHGLGRWTTDCGCRSPQRADWKQAWRGPLREALEWLARQCDAVYQREAGAYFRDFREARDAYSSRLRGEAETKRFFEAHARGELSAADQGKALRLLELQRHRLAMFTSCGWFFDDVSGLESVQCLKQAARVVELAESFGAKLALPFQELLRAAPSNDKRFEDGGKVYDLLAKPARVDARRAAAQAALLEHLGWPRTKRSCDWGVQTTPVERAEKAGLAGRDRSYSVVDVKVESSATLEKLSTRASVYQRDRVDLSCRLSDDGAPGTEISADDFKRLDEQDFSRSLDAALGADAYKLDCLYGEERRDALRLLMPGPLDNPARKVFLQGWLRALTRLSVNPASDEVLDYLLKCQAHDLSAARLPGADLVRAHWEDVVLPEAVERASPVSLSRLSRWLEAFEKSALPVSLWRLRQAFWIWRRRILENGARAGEREAALALGERLKFSDKALAFEGVPS